MKTAACALALAFLCLGSARTNAGVWNDHFQRAELDAAWTGDRTAFRISHGVMEGVSASPVAISSLKGVEVARGATDFTVGCWMNVVEPNLHVCTKGALLLRRAGDDGYVFALHEATQTIELYRLSNQEMLLKRDARIELRKWYHVRADLQGPKMSFFIDGQWVGSVTDSRQLSGAVGLAVQDADAVWFDDFTVTGSNVAGNVDGITRPELSVAMEVDHQVTLRFTASPAYDYFVQASSSPWSHDWTTLQSFRSKLIPIEAVVTEPMTNLVRFYRVEKVDCLCD